MMKQSRILNPQLAAAMAALRHNDYLVLAGSNMPVESSVPLIDLSLVPGVPGLPETLHAVAEELVIDSYILPSELETAAPIFAAAVKGELEGLTCKEVLYEQLKVLAKHASAVVRTGDMTPCAGVILLGGLRTEKE